MQKFNLLKLSLSFMLLNPWPALAADAAAQKEEILRLWNSNQKKKAESLLNDWLSDEKKSPEPWIMAAQLNFEKKKYSKTLAYGEKALDRSPSAGDAYYWRGLAYEALKKPMDAANELRAAILAQTTEPDAQAALDRVQAQLGTIVDGVSSVQGTSTK